MEANGKRVSCNGGEGEGSRGPLGGESSLSQGETEVEQESRTRAEPC